LPWIFVIERRDAEHEMFKHSSSRMHFISHQNFPSAFAMFFISRPQIFTTLFSINYFMVYLFVSIFHFQSDFSMLFCLFSRFFRRCGGHLSAAVFIIFCVKAI